MAYFDLDSLLADEELVPVVFLTDVVGLGCLNAGSVEDDITANSRLELPLWLCRDLSQRNVVSVQLPRNFGGKVREHLLADPSVVRLRDRSPYFYEVGLALSTLVPHEEGVTLPTAVRVALAARVAHIIDFALNSIREDVSTFSGPLTDLERSLFTSGLHFAKDRDAWKRKAASRIGTSTVVTTAARASAKRRRGKE